MSIQASNEHGNDNYGTDLAEQFGQAISVEIAKSIGPCVAEAVKSAIGGISSEVAEHSNRIKVLEEDEAFKKRQAFILDQEIAARASNLLGITWINGRATDDCIMTKKLYYGRLRATIINDFKKSIHVSRQEKWMYLPRKYYDDFIEFIRSYEPIGGVEAFKKYVDKSNAADDAAKAQAQMKI